MKNWMLFRKGFNEFGGEAPRKHRRSRGLGGRVGRGLDVTIGLGKEGIVPAFVANEDDEGETKITTGPRTFNKEVLPLPDTLLPWGKWFKKVFKKS